MNFMRKDSATAAGLTLCILTTFFSPVQASEEEFLVLQSITAKSIEHPETGTVSIEAVTDGSRYQKIAITAFGKKTIISDEDLRKLEGFPLSSLRLTHAAGYEMVGGHTVSLRFRRTFYDQTKNLVNEEAVISIPRNAPATVTKRSLL
jgi:hypothetical protein